MLTAVIFCVLVTAGFSNEVLKLLPDRWDGDTYRNYSMQIEGSIPKWLNGYFVCQISASYGPYAKPGIGIEHLFDAVAAVASFRVSDGNVIYSARYYPQHRYDVWRYYDRDFGKFGVAWYTGFSASNISSRDAWSKVPRNGHEFPSPMVDFWKIGKDVVAGTEFYLVGPRFDPDSLDNFQMYPFTEENTLFPDHTVVKMNMPIHARWDTNGTIWNTVAVFDIKTSALQQVVFSVSPEGVRRVEGIYNWSRFDPSLCTEGKYAGNYSETPGYMHSITSTENYVILPVSSAPSFYQCTVPPKIVGGLEYPSTFPFSPSTPMRFLIFDKRRKSFLPILWGPKSRLPMHQFNAFEANGEVTVDMLSYDNMDPYTTYTRRDFIANNPFPANTRISRFVLNVRTGSVVEKNLAPFERFSAEFSQYNHAYSDKPYHYGYLVTFPLSVGSGIMKMDFDDPTGLKNLVFQPRPTAVLAEPQFVPSPSPTAEDDGVLMFRGSDIRNNQTILYFVHAQNMTLLAKATLQGMVTPAGLHNQFYFTESLKRYR